MRDNSVYMLGGISSSLNRISPPSIHPSVKEAKTFGYFIISLNDGTPEFEVHGFKFYHWLRSPKASWDALKKIASRKTTKPTQQHLPLD